FAEYDCSACHHDLKGRERANRGNEPGTLPWGTWYFPLLPDALGDDAPRGLADDLSALRERMREYGADRQGVAAAARSAAEKLGASTERVAGHGRDAAGLGRELRQVGGERRQVAEANWDGAAQLYLAIAAFHQARSDRDRRAYDDGLKSRIRALGEALAFPPAAAPGQRYDGPDETSPARVREALQRVRE